MWDVSSAESSWERLIGHFPLDLYGDDPPEKTKTWGVMTVPRNTGTQGMQAERSNAAFIELNRIYYIYK